MNLFTRILVAVAASLSFGAASAAEAGFPLDPFPTHKLTDEPSLQNGAKLFVNYCLNCHSANLMRYNRLRDIGLERQGAPAGSLHEGNRGLGAFQAAVHGGDARPLGGKEAADRLADA